MDGQKFCLKWDGFQNNVTSVFDLLRQDEELIDITLCCEGQRVKAHRMMLSACSPYFRDILKNNQCQHMVIFLKDTHAADLLAIIEFMYKGSVNVSQTQLASFIKTAEMLQIRGLSGDDDKPAPPTPRQQPSPSPRPQRPATPPAKRRRTSGQEQPEPARSPAPAAAAEPSGPAAPLSRHAADSPLSASNQSAPSPAPPPPPLPPPPPAAPPAVPQEVKVEKVDLTEEEDDVSLDATLGYVAEYEGGEYGEPPAELTMASLAGHDASSAMGGLAGPSQRLSEDGSAQGGHVCGECGARYAHRVSLSEHVKRHRGLTRCAICSEEFAVTFTLRRHMVRKHGLNAEDAGKLTNQRWTIQGRPNMPAGAAARASLAPEPTASGAAGQLPARGDLIDCAPRPWMAGGALAVPQPVTSPLTGLQADTAAHILRPPARLSAPQLIQMARVPSSSHRRPS